VRKRILIALAPLLGDQAAEARWRGQPWIFTNPITIE
jgi:hypothetical protein